MHKHQNGLSRTEQFVLLSAHDSTLLALMSAMDFKELDIPYYASYMAFELYHDLADNNYHVKLFYNDKLLTIPTCTEECVIDSFHQ